METTQRLTVGMIPYNPSLARLGALFFKAYLLLNFRCSKSVAELPLINGKKVFDIFTYQQKLRFWNAGEELIQEGFAQARAHSTAARALLGPILAEREALQDQPKDALTWVEEAAAPTIP